MEQIASPDKPAYFCYAIVVLVGLWVAYAKVNKLMASSQERWGFLGTWLVFTSYAVVPVLLFWFLDFTNAIHDTSMFAALLVALGYRQILAGETKGVALPGQFSALWSPFETWANQVRDRIATKSKVRGDRSNDKLQSILAEDPQRVEDLAALAYRKTDDQAQIDSLDADLAAINAAVKPAEITQDAFLCNKTRRKVARCLRSIRTVNPKDYGNDLYEAQLLTSRQYWFGLRNLDAYFWLGYGLLFISFLLVALGSFFVKPENQLTYHLWRFQKVNATERDRFRTHKFLTERINDARLPDKNPFKVIEPVIGLLRYRDIDRRVSENILALILEFRRPGLTEKAVAALIDALRTENPDVRLRIHQALQALRALAYENSTEDKELAAWVPSKDESTADVEGQIKKYRAWWDSISRPAPTNTPAPSS